MPSPRSRTVSASALQSLRIGGGATVTRRTLHEGAFLIRRLKPCEFEGVSNGEEHADVDGCEDSESATTATQNNPAPVTQNSTNMRHGRLSPEILNGKNGCYPTPSLGAEMKFVLHTRAGDRDAHPIQIRNDRKQREKCEYSLAVSQGSATLLVAGVHATCVNADWTTTGFVIKVKSA